MTEAENPYPSAEGENGRVVRRWIVELLDYPADPDLPALGEMLAAMIQMSRRTAFANLGKDLDLLAPVVRISRKNSLEIEVCVSYDPKGTVGDCELICLWTPIQVLNALWRVDLLQGRSREFWRPFLTA